MSLPEPLIPKSLGDALKAKAGKNVVAIAGGTDILVKLHDRFDDPQPKLLILDHLKAIHKIAITKKEVTIGPLVTFSEIEKSDILKAHASQLTEAASLAGSTQIRNRATIGGNLANGSPAGDLISPLYVLGASLELSSSKSKRIVPIEEFFIGPGKTVLKSNELITAIKIPKLNNHGFFLRLATRRALAISKVSVAASLIIENKKIESIKIALGAVAPTVIRATRTEELLLGKALSPQVIADAASIIKEEARPIDDIRSNALYRKEMVGVLLKRGLEGILNG
ncbi:MAG TPA: xanthine dehydrogenase family protein subunit M [candidate division Zixibacteria bacterium]|nr:xanthine dehydrogenase family protein subunit M [candidate division Zixibacteria bacterium]